MAIGRDSTAYINLLNVNFKINQDDLPTEKCAPWRLYQFVKSLTSYVVLHRTRTKVFQHSANTEYFGCHVNSSTMTWYDSETEFLIDFAFLLICCGEYLMFVLVLCQRERDGT